MSGYEPTHWTNTVTKAAWTLLLVAAASFVAWRVLEALLPALLVVLVVLGIYRLVLRRY
jgi:hypothetical protein